MKHLKFTTLLVLMLISAGNLLAQQAKDQQDFNRFYLKPYGGFIGIQNMNVALLSGSQTTNINIEGGFGYTTGISVGYNFTKNISAEFGWEYKSNEITVTYNNSKTTGDYASNFIQLNGIYNFNTNGLVRPYIGAGVSLIQEIDMDLSLDENSSFSNSGNIGLQGIAGLDLNFSKKWAVNLEAKYVSFGEFDMAGENTDLALNNLQYNPFIFNIGF